MTTFAEIQVEDVVAALRREVDEGVKRAVPGSPVFDIHMTQARILTSLAIALNAACLKRYARLKETLDETSRET